MSERERDCGGAKAPELVAIPDADDASIWARVWNTTSTPIAKVVILHGIVSHGGWYLDTARCLAESGVEVHLLDRRGSGLNVTHRGDVDCWEQWPADVEHYLQALGSSSPVILIGISWGAKLAAAVAKRGRVELAGLGLICPGLCARQSPGSVKRSLVRLVNATPLRAARVRVPLRDPSLFTDDPGWKTFVRTDPLALRLITIRFAREDLRLTQFVHACDVPFDLPTLLVLAGKDRIVRLPDTIALVRKLTKNTLNIREYPNAAHTLEFGCDASSYAADLLTWVAAVSKGTTDHLPDLSEAARKASEPDETESV